MPAVLSRHTRYGAEPVENHKFIRDYDLTEFEYQALLTTIINENATDLKRVQNAIALATQLKVVYARYLANKREAYRLKRNIAQLQHILNPDTKLLPDDPELHPSLFIRKHTREKNPVRLFIGRLLRQQRTLLLIISATSQYAKTVRDIDKNLAPILSWASWTFFIPRLLNNFYMLAKHLIKHDGMSEEEKRLSFYLRLRIQLTNRWPELANDIAWFVVNYIIFRTADIATGTTLSAALQLYDVLIAIYRRIHEINKYNNIKEAYQKLPEDKQDKKYIVSLEAWIHYETRQRNVLLINFTLVLLTYLITIPLVTTSIELMIIGTTCSALLSIATYITQQYTEKYHRPPTDLSKLGLFKSPGDDSAPNTDVSKHLKHA